MTEYDRKETVLSLGNIDRELVDTFKNAPLPIGSPNQTLELKRQLLSGLEKSGYENFPTLGSHESVLHIPMRDGHQSEIRVFKPASPSVSASQSPLVALLFGGGFITGSNLQLVPSARALVSLHGATVVTLSYRLAPEHKFPTAAHDAWDSVQWLAEHATELGANLSEGFVLGGVSAGANLAIVTAHKAQKEKLAAPLTGLWSCIPPALGEEVIPAEYKDLWLSREQNAEAPVLSAKETQLVDELYQQDPTSEEFTPFSPQATSFAGIPRTYVQVAGLDVLRDDGLIYEKALRNHGVETKLDVYPGVPHGHFVVFPHLKSSIKSKRDTLVGIGWLLGREEDSEMSERLETLFKPGAKSWLL